ncbi:MAG: polysaccharide deacetylase family protein [Candidatus Norongarragalinales archaeon]
MKKTLVAFTIDVDRDAADFIKGIEQGGTRTAKGVSEKASFDASAAGFAEILLVLDGLGIPATFFLEGNAALELENKIGRKLLHAMAKKHEVGSHGNAHEDYTGEGTGVKMSREDIEKSIEQSSKSIRRVFSIRPQGFRAPYLHYDEALDTIIRRSFDYDSSLYGKKVSCERGFCRVPVFEDVDAKGKRITGYLWPLMEGKRTVQDYLALVDKALKQEVELIVLATHSWHHRYSFGKGRAKTKSRAEADLRKIALVLKKIKSNPKVEFSTLSAALKQLNEKKGL